MDQFIRMEDCVSSILTIIIFLLPGLTAVQLNNALDPLFKDRTRPSSELESMVFAVVNNLPAIFLGWGLWSLFECKLLSFAAWSKQLDQWPWAVAYFVVSTVIAFVINRCLKPWLMANVAERRNTQRKKNKLPSFDDVEVWEAFIGSEETLGMRIRSTDGCTIISGVMERTSRPNDVSQGVILQSTQEMTELADLLTEPVRTYMDTRTGLIYELFDSDAVAQALKVMGETR